MMIMQLQEPANNEGLLNACVCTQVPKADCASAPLIRTFLCTLPTDTVLSFDKNAPIAHLASPCPEREYLTP